MVVRGKEHVAAARQCVAEIHRTLHATRERIEATKELLRVSDDRKS
jgi:hypothetical protein